MFSIFVKIFSQVKYVILLVVIFVVTMSGVLLLPNIRLLIEVYKSSNASFGEFFSLILSLMGSIQTNFTTTSAINTILIALLFGVSVSIITYRIQDRKRKLKNDGIVTSTTGFVSGILGIGCASCGSLLISLLGIGGALTFLPFGGQEFGFIGVILLSLSIYFMLRKMSMPETCEI